MPTDNFHQAVPIEFFSEQEELLAKDEIRTYVLDWKGKVQRSRHNKVNIWNECWELYRGKEDFSSKEDWHSKIVLPKSFNSVKQATSTIKRFLTISRDPWSIEAENPDDLVTAFRAGQITQLVRAFLENANYREEFSIGLESGFIIGLSVWKLWWELAPREKLDIEEKLLEDGSVQKDLVRKEILEGRLSIKAVDPYRFFWLPGSKLNNWTGTIEVIRVPRWQLRDMILKGAFNSADPGVIDKLGSKTTTEAEEQTATRFDEPSGSGGSPNKTTDTIELLEYFGPIVQNDEVIEPNGHVVIADGTEVLTYGKQSSWTNKPPYVGFSPLSIPFRTEGVGLVEMVREIDKGLNRLANLSMDTLLFRLLPIYEVYPDMFENEEDFSTGLVPGKFFRRNMTDISGVPGIRPIQFQDISPGTVQIAGLLDRAHQEGSLVSEIQQSIPRWRGVQTATESDLKANQQDTFFGNLAAEVEEKALQPIVELAMDLVLQNLDTARDERVASILGINYQSLASMSRPELMEIVNGDYKVKVTGISNQIEKASALQNLVQFMNIIGQNGEAWVPYVRQDVLLRKILDAFRPAITDIDDIIETPEVAEAKLRALGAQKVTPDMLKALPGIMRAEQAQQAAQQQEAEANMIKEINIAKMIAEIEKIYAEIQKMKESGGEK